MIARRKGKATLRAETPRGVPPLAGPRGSRDTLFWISSATPSPALLSELGVTGKLPIFMMWKRERVAGSGECIWYMSQALQCKQKFRRRSALASRRGPRLHRPDRTYKPPSRPSLILSPKIGFSHGASTIFESMSCTYEIAPNATIPLWRGQADSAKNGAPWDSPGAPCPCSSTIYLIANKATYSIVIRG
jgi:hypothetical protein